MLFFSMINQLIIQSKKDKKKFENALRNFPAVSTSNWSFCPTVQIQKVSFTTINDSEKAGNSYI